jgi:D-glucosaminate-6-phosphate ammonia-lyase
MGIYEELEVTPVINACGYVTRFSGSLMLPEVVEAMVEASKAYVSIAELQEAAGSIIAEYTGAESGYVTSGAAAGLTLAAATCIAGTDRDRIARLPDTGDAANEIVIPGPHRDSYDRCFRLCGARIVMAGSPDLCTEDDLAATISARTAAVAWFSAYEPVSLSLADVVRIAHAAGTKVIVDAAVALPPPENLRRFVETGADLVSFSGGKDLRGPQTSGFLAGSRELMKSVALQHQDFAAYNGTWDPESEYLGPGHGIGRPMKVGKEELAGLLVALRLYGERDHAAEDEQQAAGARLVASRIQGMSGITVETGRSHTPGHYVRLTVDVHAAGTTARQIASELAGGKPRIMVAPAFFNEDRELTIGFATLQPGEAEVIAERLVEVVARLRR